MGHDYHTAPISPNLKALLAIAEHVQQSGKEVSAADVEHARAARATDMEIHDAVLIAAAFCMFNRYVDGLATFTPTECFPSALRSFTTVVPPFTTKPS